MGNAEETLEEDFRQIKEAAEIMEEWRELHGTETGTTLLRNFSFADSQ